MAAINAGSDPIFGIHARALAVQAKRMEVLSANIANADTPGYEARDVDFAKILANAGSTGTTSGTSASSHSGPAASTTDPRHIPIIAGDVDATAGGALPYRVATQPSVDGNSVDVQVEQAKFADAAMHYQASLGFANGRIKELMSALSAQ